jgi:hypothetical protein
MAYNSCVPRQLQAESLRAPVGGQVAVTSRLPLQSHDCAGPQPQLLAWQAPSDCRGVVLFTAPLLLLAAVNLAAALASSWPGCHDKYHA